MPHHHFKLYKPCDYLSQFAEEPTKKSKKVLGLLGEFPEGTMAIGRLDERSEGLLLLTTDGKMSAAVRSKLVEKEYYAQVDGIIDDEAIDQLKKGVDIPLEGGVYHTLPCKAELLTETPHLPPRGRKIRDERHGPTSWVTITVTEGKFRQVRKMTAAVGFPTLRLVRVRIGNLTIEELHPGAFKTLTKEDLSCFMPYY